MDRKAPFIEGHGLGKRFGGAQALAGVDLSLSLGEVHALVGENGAGKSTLGKCLAGVLRPDEGKLLVDGREVDYHDPRDALQDGIAIVEQELALVPAMTVADNVLLGFRPPGAAGRRAGRAAVRELSEKFSLGLDVDARVEQLPVAEQQKVEILRALARQARLIVMDEPTARLARDEAENLLGIIRRLAESGAAVVYVSHFLAEVLEVSDRVTVMRNGAVVKSGPAAAETPATLVTAMLGRSATLSFPDKRPIAADSPCVLSVRDLGDAATVSGVSFDVRRGEIVGLGGPGRKRPFRGRAADLRRRASCFGLDRDRRRGCQEPLDPQRGTASGSPTCRRAARISDSFSTSPTRRTSPSPTLAGSPPAASSRRRRERQEATAMLERLGGRAA